MRSYFGRTAWRGATGIPLSLSVRSALNVVM